MRMVLLLKYSKMLGNVTAKLNMTIEEFARRCHEFGKLEHTENDNLSPGIPDTSILSEEEADFLCNYVTIHGL